MQPKLAKVLIERGVIRQGTVIEAYQSVKGLSCACDSYAVTRYVVLGASATNDWVFLNAATSPTDRQRVRCDFVASIDGMHVDRVAAAHHLLKDGSAVGSSSRRKRAKRKRLALPSHQTVEDLPAVVAQQAPALDSLAHHQG